MGGSSIARRRLLAGALAVGLIVLVVLLASGGGDPAAPGDEGYEGSPTTPADTEQPADSTAEMSTEQLVDQVLLIGFEGTDSGASVVQQVRDHELGGVLVFAQNWDGKGAGTKLIDAIRKAARGGAAPPLIATDQEGGSYRALDDLPPSQREIEIGDKGSRKGAERWGREGAEALAKVGIDLNLAPVADVATLDSPIADRAFSDDAGVAAEMTAGAVEGCESAGVACAVSHFPGLGGASQDTNLGPAPVAIDAATLRSRDLVPFAAAFEAGVPAVVVSHGLYSAFDAVTPASLLPAITTDLLRDELGFEGVAISDDIGAGAISASTKPAEAAVEAMNAGIDLIQVAEPRDVDSVRRALLAAAEDGAVSEERLREAAGRVLALKEELAAAARKGGGKGDGAKGDEGRKAKGESRGKGRNEGKSGRGKPSPSGRDAKAGGSR